MCFEVIGASLRYNHHSFAQGMCSQGYRVALGPESCGLANPFYITYFIIEYEVWSIAALKLHY